MAQDITVELSRLTRAACAYAPRDIRPAMATAFALDERLAGIVTRMSEPVLAQMRLAWWRDRLREPADLNPAGDAVLDAIGQHWTGERIALIALVDGWEELTAIAPHAGEALGNHAQGRAAMFAAIARMAGRDDAVDAADAHGRWYALGDCAARSGGGEELDSIRDLAGDLPEALPLPASLRPLAILSGLARRSLRLGGRPLLGDRASPFVLMRLGIFGR